MYIYIITLRAKAFQTKSLLRMRNVTSGCEKYKLCNSAPTPQEKKKLLIKSQHQERNCKPRYNSNIGTRNSD